MVRERMEKGCSQTKLQGQGDRRKTRENMKYQKRDDVNQRGVSTTVRQDPPSPATRMSLEPEANAESVEWW